MQEGLDMKSKLYDLIKESLEEHEQLRNSDKALMFTIWNKMGLVHDRSISYENFKKAPTPESITRARRKVQELHPELQATSGVVRSKRQQKERTKGTFVFRETLF